MWRKKTILVVLIISILTACQPTPEKNIVVPKDNIESLIKQTIKPSNNEIEEYSNDTVQTLFWEDHFEYDREVPAEGKINILINIAVDAKVNICDIQKESSPIFLVKPRTFSLQFAEKVSKYFLGSEVYDDMRTKDDLLNIILYYQKALPLFKGNQLQNAKYWIERYSEELKEAPDENVEGIVEFETTNVGESIKLKGYTDSGLISYIVINNNGLSDTTFYYTEADVRKKYYETYDEYKGIAARGMKMNYEEAKKTAEKALYSLCDFDFNHEQTVLANASILDKNWSENYLLIPNDNFRDQCYVFYYTPVYELTPQLYAPKAKNSNHMQLGDKAVREPSWQEEYSQKWPAEYICVYVDDEGIVEFWWFSPTDIIDTISEHTKIMPFNDVIEIFKSNIFYSSVWAGILTYEVNILIDRIVFGMVRIPIENDFDTYYMVPAWQFIGSKSELALDPDLNYEENGKTYMVINAIDGSIIDTSYYENRRLELKED